MKRRRKRKRLDAEPDCCCVVGEVFGGVECCLVTASLGGHAGAEPVRVLRAYRDQRLARRAPGRAFTAAYYRYGRHGARLLRRYPQLKPPVRLALRPLVAYARRRVAG